MTDLTHRVALVTGASRGIGRTTALELARRGAQVAALARTEREVAEVVDQINSTGGSALALACDVSRLEPLAAAIDEITRRLGPVNILVNNAAILGPLGPTAEIDPQDWTRTLNINLHGAFYAIRLVLPGMIAGGWGRIINVSSGAAIGQGIVRASAYSVSKAGMDMLTRTLAAEIDGTDVAVVTVYPGVVNTEMQAEIRQAPAERFGAATSARFHGFHERGELLDPVLPARLIAALCGPAGPQYHGQAVRISDPAGQELLAGLTG